MNTLYVIFIFLYKLQLFYEPSCPSVVGWLVGWMIDWLIGWRLVSLLVGWSVCPNFSRRVECYTEMLLSENFFFISFDYPCQYSS